MKDNNLTKFIVPHDEIKAVNKELQNIPELAQWFAYGTAFVSYTLSHTNEAGKLMLDEFSKEQTQQSLDTIIRLDTNKRSFHSCMKTKEGQFWVVPVFCIPTGKLTIGVTEIAAYINFNVNSDTSTWYVIIFKYDITTVALPKNGALLKIKYD